MKKLLLTGLAVAGLTASTFAQGNIAFDNSQSANGITDLTAGNFYNGTAGIEVWALPGSPVTATISAINALSANPLAGYALLTSDGFNKVATYSGVQIAGGAFSLGELSLTAAQLSTPGGPLTLGLAAWNNSANSWAGSLAAGAQTSHYGVIAFDQTTTYAASAPFPTPASLNWGVGGGSISQDLVMTSVPEPSTIALAGLGAAAMLIFRRRK
jgi:hypothetical protein